MMASHPNCFTQQPQQHQDLARVRHSCTSFHLYNRLPSRPDALQRCSCLLFLYSAASSRHLLINSEVGFMLRNISRITGLLTSMCPLYNALSRVYHECNGN
mmetsp:Transcript_27129/g.52322  ORF Transcript_27129/g.52322 Transcript_27129/m.52322 type:complete len:101 (-) Transcript_27129:104-406(-)